MTIDFWGLGLQAVNVLILVWILSRLFWQPIAAAIARRQAQSRAAIDTAKAAQIKAEAELADLSKARAGLAQEREALLDAARAEADAATKAAIAMAQTKAEETLAAAQVAADHATEASRKANRAQASDLAFEIASRMLMRLNGPTVQAAFLDSLVAAMATLPKPDREALMASPDGITIVTPTDPGADRKAIKQVLQNALGDTPTLHFSTDPALIAGLELRSAHFVLHNSWQADLAQVRKAVNDAP